MAQNTLINIKKPKISDSINEASLKTLHKESEQNIIDSFTELYFRLHR